LDVVVDLDAIRAVQVDRVLPVRGDGVFGSQGLLISEMAVKKMYAPTSNDSGFADDVDGDLALIESRKVRDCR
jgi:hypothetical protein